MDCAHLSDTELLRLVGESGEASVAALDELEQRHFPAVRALASAVTASETAADELACQSWDEALRQQQDGGASGAVRPNALSSVLRSASAWVRGGQGSALNRELDSWIEANGLVALADPTTPESHPGSLMARAFAGLTGLSQATLWHQTVERDESALTGKLTGADPGKVSTLTGRARRALHNSYVQIFQDGMQYECLRFHRMVLAHAEEKSPGIAEELAPHLDRCDRCGRALADLGSVWEDCGALLARALLPYGGPEYAAGRTELGIGQEEFAPGAEVPPMPGPAASGSTASDDPVPGGPASGPRNPETSLATPSPDALTPDAPGPDPQVSEALATELWTTGSGGPGRSRGTRIPAARRGRLPAVFGVRTKSRRRDLLVGGGAVAGLCGIGAAVVLGFAVDDPPEGQPQGGESAPPVRPPSSPSSEAPRPSSSTAAADGSEKTTRPPSKPRTNRPSSPPADGTSVEWLFDGADGGTTPDTSGNNRDGTLVGPAPASAVAKGALRSDDGHFVAANGPLVDTSRSFSVSARVKLNDTDRSQTVVSQHGSRSSAFLLQYDAEESQWEMRIPEGPSDDPDADADEAVSDVEVEAGQWTHLTGVYDEAAGKVRLYVNGSPGESVDHEEDFASRGDFIVGRGLAENRFFRAVDGTVDDVRAFGKAVSPAEARSLARRS